ncbi:glycosyltransferase family 4 protein [Kaistia granuli]|uniref:glycosyltransferase family 4 protein n=1 Tax=Kaistia granuli TaxID=363259 RepID=UPI0003820F9A|nr:glycosyltransferase family 4 protein [Kaistia granuli]
MKRNEASVLAAEPGALRDGLLPTPLNVTVIQDGARLRYALPLALKAAGILGTVHTDWFIRSGSAEALMADAMAKISKGAGRRLAGRRCADLAGSRVVATGWPALISRLLESRAVLPEEIFVQRSRAICRQVLDDGWRGANVLAGFVRNIDPLLCEVARHRNITVISDQMIAPIDVQIREEARQAERWPGWETAVAAPGAAIMRQIEQRTWQASDHITCASSYVRDGLLQQGIEPDRISVIPYPVDANAFAFQDRRERSGPVRIGFVGHVSLRKGSPAFLQIARAFDPQIVRFILVGPVALDAGRVDRHRGQAHLTGSVPASAVRYWLESFDIFLFPSACEGSAGAVMEAMATGLPIVTTPNSGTPVRHGVEGFVHGCEDIDGMKDSIERLIRDPALRLQMGEAARRRVETMTIPRYGAAWHQMLQRIR